jgi:hypothetical protein
MATGPEADRHLVLLALHLNQNPLKLGGQDQRCAESTRNAMPTTNPIIHRRNFASHSVSMLTWSTDEALPLSRSLRPRGRVADWECV